MRTLVEMRVLESVKASVVRPVVVCRRRGSPLVPELLKVFVPKLRRRLGPDSSSKRRP